MADDPFADWNWDLVPTLIREPLRRYFAEGVPPASSFIIALLSNDLRMSVLLADEHNLARLHDLTRFLENYAPRASWGSGEAVADWEFMGGLRGREFAEMEAMRDG